MKFRNCTWFTNLLVDKSANPIVPYIKYEDGLKRGLYPKYDNYDAIEVSKVAEIPEDYYGAMGVPITFLDRWVPPIARAKREREREEYVVLGIANSARGIGKFPLHTIINGKKIYNRIIIKRVPNYLDDR